MDEILHAKNTGVTVGNKFTGYSTEGMPIIGYLLGGKIDSAYPNI